MRLLQPILLLPVLLLTPAAESRSDLMTPEHGVVEILVTSGLTPLSGASVALDLNNNGVWDEHLGEPRDWTDANGTVVFSDVVAIQHPGSGIDPRDVALDWHPSRVMMGNVRGNVGAPDVQVDFVLPAGSGTASLGLYDLRGRCIAQTHGRDDLALNLPGGLASGVYFLRLSAEPAAPVSQRITSAGVRTQSIRASQVSVAEAVAAGWVETRPLEQGKRSQDGPYPINLIVEHDGYLAVVQPEVIEPGSYQFFTVQMEAEVPAGFVFIPPGTFTMGSPDDEPGRESYEGPQHQVTLTHGFYISQYEVTEQWWYQVMGGAPTTSQLPKIWVSWDLAVQFCNALSAQQGLTLAYTIHGPDGDVTWNQEANGYRLPTEAEWEYACRAATTLAYHNDTNCLDSTTEANFNGFYVQLPDCPLGFYRQVRTEVGSFPANQGGLHDMHGNLWEWVWCGLRAYAPEAQVDPVHGAGPGVRRVVRGGGWSSEAQNCRSAERYDYHPTGVDPTLGFRPVRSAI
jgi:formylglycine-generating enzyme required for sulfatase activity